MKPEFFNRLNLIGTIVFLLGFAGILFFVDPFKAGTFVVSIFYFVIFFLVFGITNLLSGILKIPVWCRLLIAGTITAILILQKHF
jgi:hypothetical protein